MPPPFAQLVGDLGDDDWRPPPRVPSEIAASLPILVRDREQWLSITDPEELAVIVAQLMLHYRQPERPEEQNELVFGDWLDDLAEYPTAVVREATREWRWAKKFRPTIAEMRDLCEGLLATKQRELLRLKVLTLAVERHGGQVPVLWTRLGGDRLVDYEERATGRHLEALLRDERDMGGMVWALPGDDAAPAPALPPPPPPLAAMIAEAEAAQPAEPPPPPPLSPRQQVLRILLVGGLTVAEIEAGNMLDILDDEVARMVVAGREPAAAPPPPAPPPEPDPGSIPAIFQAARRDLGEAVYLQYLASFEVREDEDTIVLDAPTRFARDWVNDRYGAALRRAADKPVEIIWSYGRNWVMVV